MSYCLFFLFFFIFWCVNAIKNNLIIDKQIYQSNTFQRKAGIQNYGTTTHGGETILLNKESK